MAIWGTPPDSIDDAEDRDKWYDLLTRLDIRQPPGGMVTSEEGALAEAAKLGYPVRSLTLHPKPWYGTLYLAAWSPSRRAPWPRKPRWATWCAP